MKIEFDGSEFDSGMKCGHKELHSEGVEAGKRILGEYGGLVLGIISFVLAVSNLLFGLFMNFSTEILSKISGGGMEHWISVLIVSMAILIAFSVICGVFSIILFAKSDKRLLHVAGFVFAIISFTLCFVSIGLNIAGVIAW